jgi:hypothetical protein
VVPSRKGSSGGVKSARGTKGGQQGGGAGREGPARKSQMPAPGLRDHRAGPDRNR